MSSKIDKTQPYASICGDDLGRVYEQNHTFYGADGNEWTDYSTPAPAPAPAPAKADLELELVPKTVPAKAAERSHKKAPADKTPPAPSADADDQLSAQLDGGTD